LGYAPELSSGALSAVAATFTSRKKLLTRCCLIEATLPVDHYFAQVPLVRNQDRARLCQANVETYLILGLLTATSAPVGQVQGISSCSRSLAVTVLCSSGKGGSSAFKDLGAFNEVRFSLSRGHQPAIQLETFLPRCTPQCTVYRSFSFELYDCILYVGWTLPSPCARCSRPARQTCFALLGTCMMSQHVDQIRCTIADPALSGSGYLKLPCMRDSPTAAHTAAS
jgi:hypothetical protein